MSDEECSLEGEERIVLSEVHLGRDDSNARCDDSEDGVMLSRYHYLVPSPSSVEIDDDDCKSSSPRSSNGDSDSEGDILIRRRRKRLRAASAHESCEPAHEVLTIVHRIATPVSFVGQQVWSAAFLLGDFILTHEELFAGANVLELGSGPGVAGLIAARVARQTFLTDHYDEILALLARNVEANMHLVSHRNAAPETINSYPSENTTEEGSGEAEMLRWRPVEVRKLDWLTLQIDAEVCSESGGHHQDAVASREHCREETSPFYWRYGELEHLISMRATDDSFVVIASDVIYDEDLTEAFFRVLEVLMPSPQTLEPDTEDSEGDNSNNTPINSSSADQERLSARGRGETPAKLRRTPKLMTCGIGLDNADTRRENRPVLYLALEKRFNFTIKEMSVVATGYRAFRRNVFDVTDDSRRYRGQDGHADSLKFEGVRLPLSFQQCFRYPRGENMEIWEIKRREMP